MIVKLKGTIDGHSENHIDVDVRDIVYRILMTTSNVKIFKEVNSEVEVFIHEIIKEDARILVGFRKLKEREIFCNLLSVQGVGSKMALNIISELQSEEIINSLRNEIITNFTKISGIGKKLAQRIINELKDKANNDKLLKSTTLFASKKNKTLFDDLYSCIVNLGYQSKIAEEISRQIIIQNKNKELEELIPLALKTLKIQSK